MKRLQPAPEMVYKRFEIKEKLGEGSQVSVYYAYDKWAGGDVVLKLPRGRRFTEKVLAFRKDVSHPLLLSPLEITPEFITYEPFKGVPLSRCLLSLSLPERMRIFRQLLLFLGHLHEKGWVHGDLSPENILLKSNEIKITDVGMAVKVGEKPEGVGHLFYASPEALKGEPLTPHSDIYSLGCILYHFLTDRPPFYARKIEDSLRMRKKPVIEISPKTYQEILREMLSWNREERPFPAREIIKKLEEEEKVKIFGRESEIRIFHEFICKKKGGILWIEGEAGIGKTTLLRYFVNLARKEGWLSIYARTVREVEREIKRRKKIWGVEGDVPEVVRIFPVFIALDDIHEDFAKLDFIKRLFPITLSSPLLIAGAFRPFSGDLPPGEKLKLQGLDKKAFFEYLEYLQPSIEKKHKEFIYALSNANPFYGKAFLKGKGENVTIMRELFLHLSKDEEILLLFLAYFPGYPVRELPVEKKALNSLKKKGLVYTEKGRAFISHEIIREEVKKILWYMYREVGLFVQDAIMEEYSEEAGDFFLDIGMEDFALMYYEDALEEYENKGRLDDVLRVCEKMLKECGIQGREFTEIWWKAAKILKMKGDAKKLEEHIKKYKSRIPRKLREYYEGMVAFLKGDFETTYRIFGRLIEGRRHYMYLPSIVTYLSALVVLGRMEEAEKVAEIGKKEIKRGDSLYPALCNTVGFMEYEKGNLEESIKWHKRAIKYGGREEQDVVAASYGNMGVSLASLGRWEEAYELFVKERELSLKHGLWESLYYSTVHVVAALVVLGRMREAEKYVKEVLAYLPHITSQRDRVYLVNRIARFLEKSGEIDKALSLLSELSLENCSPPTLSRIYQSLAWLNFLKGRLKKAMEFAERRKKLSEEIKDIRGGGIIDILRAKIYYAWGEEEEAEKIIRKVQEIGEKHGFSFQKESALLLLTQLKIYREENVEFPRVEPDNKNEIYGLWNGVKALYHLSRGETEQAKDILQKAVSYFLYAGRNTECALIGCDLIKLLSGEEKRYLQEMLFPYASRIPIVHWKYLDLAGKREESEKLLEELSGEAPDPQRFIEVQKRRWNFEKRLAGIQESA